VGRQPRVMLQVIEVKHLGASNALMREAEILR
jgi:hypothetical protein